MSANNSYPRRRLTVSLDGIEGVQLVITNDLPNGAMRVGFMHDGKEYDYLFPHLGHEKTLSAVRALGFPTEPLPVEEAEGHAEVVPQ